MWSRSRKVIGRAAACLSLMLIGSPGYAMLGGDPVAPGAGESARTIQTPSFSIRETQLITGTVLREYIADDTVFGVAWNGPRVPDLSNLLGGYYTKYLKGWEAMKSRPGPAPRGVSTVVLDDLVVTQGGHMMSWSGQAWLPDYLPAGVRSTDIQ